MCRAEENSGRKVRVHENRKILFGGTTVPISLLLYTIVLYSRTTYVVVHRVGYSATSTLPRLCALCSWWLCFRTTVRWTLGTKQSSTGSWYTLFQNSIFDLKYGSEEKGSSLCKCSILLGFFSCQKN